MCDRLREIEHQRIKTAESFEDPEQDGEGGHSSDSDAESRKWISPDQGRPDGDTPRQVLPMSVKSVVYGQEDISEKDDKVEVAVSGSSSRNDATSHSHNLINSTFRLLLHEDDDGNGSDDYADNESEDPPGDGDHNRPRKRNHRRSERAER